MGESVPGLYFYQVMAILISGDGSSQFLSDSKKRPDLLKNAELTQKEKNWLGNS